MRAALALVLAPHLFAGWVSDAPATVEQVTITVPSTPPVGVETAWVAADGSGSCDFTQVGWYWAPSWPAPLGPPIVFAYTDMCGQKAIWYYGPAAAPGGSVTVRIVRVGHTYTDEFLNPAFGAVWQVAYNATATIRGGPVWEFDVESYGPMERACFSGAVKGCQG